MLRTDTTSNVLMWLYEHAIWYVSMFLPARYSILRCCVCCMMHLYNALWIQTFWEDIFCQGSEVKQLKSNVTSIKAISNWDICNYTMFHITQIIFPARDSRRRRSFFADPAITTKQHSQRWLRHLIEPLRLCRLRTGHKGRSFLFAVMT